jgi:hypothetical protein
LEILNLICSSLPLESDAMDLANRANIQGHHSSISLDRHATRLLQQMK